ncbi:hypothetical protein DL95DRAFT_322143, partial [Leptodontidium sp. 2 PMI_412]
LYQLNRFIFNKCHTILDSTPEFFPEVRRLGELIERGVQMVYLTAILPPHTKPEFINIIKIRAETVHIFRASTSRPNITYSAVKYKEDKFGRGDIIAVCQCSQ